MEGITSTVNKLLADIDHSDNQAASISIILFSSYVPFVFEQLADALKSATPNMKKKKDEVFTQLKSQIIKPFKDLTTSVKDKFTEFATFWSDRSQVPLVASSEPVLAFVKSIIAHEPIASQLESTRI